ncbi:MAG: heat shock protein HspQ [Thiogranum sp.]
MALQARFSVGQIIHHLRFDYRGVVIDVDAEFRGSEEWYRQVALSRPPKDKPWYRILVDGADHMTYVAERHLESDETCKPITHPELDGFFDGFKDCTYQIRRKSN